MQAGAHKRFLRVDIRKGADARGAVDIAAGHGEGQRAAARARAHGMAVAIGHPYPETLRALSDWQDKEGVAVVPLRRIIWKLAQDRAPIAGSPYPPHINMEKE